MNGATLAALYKPPSLFERAKAITRKYSGSLFVASDAYCYSDSSGTTPATQDGVVGYWKDLTGSNHATQGTTANKPILRKGAKNFALQSNSFNTTWLNGGSVITRTQNATDYLGNTNTAWSFVPASGAAGIATIQQNTPSLLGLTITLTFEVKNGTLGTNWHEIAYACSGGTTFRAWFNAATGAVGTTSGSPTASSTSLGNGWYRNTVTFVVDGTAGAGVLFFLPTDTDNSTTITGDGTNPSHYVARAQIEVGSSFTSHALTTTAFASSGAGNWWLDFDGSNDSLALTSVPFQMATDHFVAAASGLFSKATARTLFGIASTGSDTPRIAELQYTTSGYAKSNWVDDAASASAPTGSTDLIGVDRILSASKQTNAKLIRVNATQIATDATALSTTTVTSASIGSTPKATPSQYHLGPIYGMGLGAGTISTGELYVLEQYLARISGVTL